MQSLKDYINTPRLDERFINLFKDDVEKRKEYADEVWDILQASYSGIGGLKGNGFKNKQDIIDNMPFWKIATVNGKIVTVAMYKDKGGRKRVVMGAKKTPEAKAKVVDMMLSDLKMKRSWGEMSGPAWGFLKKSVPKDLLMAALIPVKQVQKLQPGKDIVPAYGNDPSIKKSDPFRDFWFTRKIGGNFATKIAIGNAGNTIK